MTRPRVFSCADGEIESRIAGFSKGLRRADDFQSLSVSIARDIHDSHDGPSEAKILAQTLGRLSASTPLG
ncbi:MAG: hypothetical protein CL681_26300 [Blastopirellula sp.]|nr:hypothetical protein [Blastopirellula sp.]